MSDLGGVLPDAPADPARFLVEDEGPTLECKEAKATFSDKKLRRYLTALSKGAGGCTRVRPASPAAPIPPRWRRWRA